MKKLIIIILCMCSFSMQAQIHSELTRMDRLAHAGAGFVITSATTAVAYHYTEKDWQAEIIGMFVGLAFAGAKEAWDESQGGKADMYDFAATALGSTAAVATFRIIIPDGRSKKQKLLIRFGKY